MLCDDDCLFKWEEDDELDLCGLEDVDKDKLWVGDIDGLWRLWVDAVSISVYIVFIATYYFEIYSIDNDYVMDYKDNQI